MRLVGGLTALAIVLLLTSCASRRVPPQIHVDLGQAETLLHDGCYECLQQALALFERAAAQPRVSPVAARGALRSAVLLAVRSKELGLPDEPAVAVVRDWAAKQVSPSPTAVPAQHYLDALDLIDGETSGLIPEERERRNRERRAAWPGVDGQLPAARVALTPAVATDIVAQYLAVAIDCEDARARKTVDTAGILGRYPQPLMRFRLAFCGLAGFRLNPLRQADPRWRDTLFFEGRAEMSRFPAPDVGRAADLFDAAHAAFPTSVAITLALGNARNALEEHDVALALFDGILDTQPTHREALLGRLLSLSYMRRHYDAIRTASHMIGLGTYHMGDAYYWRAWNRYQVHELPSAWTDVEEATKLMVNTAVYTLAGFIAYAQRNLDTAIDRLARAYRMDNTNCEAVWTEGMVHVDKEQWQESSTRFVTAAGCFDADAKAARESIAVAQNSTWAEAVKARRIATAQKRATSSEHRHAQSAFNAASSYLRLGKKSEALEYLDVAVQHPLLKDKAMTLRATIEKMP